MDDWESSLDHIDCPKLIDSICESCLTEGKDIKLILYDLFKNDLQSAALLDLTRWICPECELEFFDVSVVEIDFNFNV